MTEQTVVSVAVDNAAKTFDKLYDYVADSSAEAGKRVIVPFGGGNRRRQAIIMQVHTQSSADGLKRIDCVLDSKPVLGGEMLRLVDFMRKRYFCTYYEAVKTVLPAGMNYVVLSSYRLNPDFNADISGFSDEEQRIICYFQRRRKPVREDKFRKDFGFDSNLEADRLVKKGVLQKLESAVRKTADAVQRMAALSENGDFSSLKLTEKQKQVCEMLKNTGPVCVGELCYFLGITRSVTDGLAKKGVIRYFDEEVCRSFKPKGNFSERAQPIVLTEKQQEVFEGIYSLCRKNEPAAALLYGVTGSGKTSVFMKLAEKIYAEGKSVIVMVPEIALTSQLIELFRSRFGDSVAVLHSALSLGERIDEYKRLKNGEAKIAVGTRSAVFAPLENIGLIIIDEEQEHTYKSESSPRFHARDIAKFRCKENNCLLLLSSATPCVESYYMAQTGRYAKFTLPSRFGGAILPEVIVEDMNVELALGNMTSFSSRLIDEIQKNLDEHRQSILLLNRRGHNTFIYCPSCRKTVVCPNCSISLTYHSANGRMMCHYCGYSAEYTGICPDCAAGGLRLGGSGTQKIENELADFFPKAKILRMDADTTVAKYSHEKKLAAFANGEYDILVGTQMVAKGLNFPNVTLVGVLNADQMLYADDFRSYERTFSLLTQVVGRSGRGSEKGRAVIQTLTPENTVIELAAAQNYDAFYNGEIGIRKAMLYPPFADICLVGFAGRNQLNVVKCADEFSKAMARICREKYSDLPVRLLGPSAAAVSRVSGKYRYRLIIKCRNSSRFREMLSQLLIDFGKKREYTDVNVYADPDPVSF